MRFALTEEALDEKRPLYLTVQDKNEVLKDSTIGSIRFLLSEYAHGITKKTQMYQAPEPDSTPFDIIDNHNRVQGKLMLNFDIECSSSRNSGSRLRIR